jgi:hypothetical protein
MDKPLPLDKTFILHAETFTFWQNLYFLAKPFPFKKTFVLHG